MTVFTFATVAARYDRADAKTKVKVVARGKAQGGIDLREVTNPESYSDPGVLCVEVSFNSNGDKREWTKEETFDRPADYVVLMYREDPNHAPTAVLTVRPVDKV